MVTTQSAYYMVLLRLLYSLSIMLSENVWFIGGEPEQRAKEINTNITLHYNWYKIEINLVWKGLRKKKIMSLTFVGAAWYSAKVIHPWIILPFIADITFEHIIPYFQSII